MKVRAAQPYVIKWSTTQVWTKDLSLANKLRLEDNSIFLLLKIVKYDLVGKIGHRNGLLAIWRWTCDPK